MSFNAREAAHALVTVRSLCWAHESEGAHAGIHGPDCDKHTAALQRAYDAGRADARASRFEPLPVPTVDTPTGQRIDHDTMPVCNVCAARGAVDRTTSCCRDCYRFEFFMLRLLVALGHRVGEPPENLIK